MSFTDTPCVYTTSGFVLPNSSLFKVVEYTPNLMAQLSSRSVTVYDDKDFVFFSENKIHRSSHLQTLHMAYSAKQTAENYLAMVEAAAKVLDGWTFSDFLYAQLNNRYLRDMAFTFCLKLYSYLRGGPSSDLITMAGLMIDNLRFNFEEGGVFDKNGRKKQLDEMIAKLEEPVSVWQRRWVLGDDESEQKKICSTNAIVPVIAFIASDPAVFSIFFKFVFTDKYRGL